MIERFRLPGSGDRCDGCGGTRSTSAAARLAALLALLSAASGCGRLAGDLAERMVSAVVDRPVVAERALGGSSTMVEAEGEAVTGRLVTFNRHPLLVKDTSPALTRRAMSMLDRGMAGSPSALSMLDVVSDRPIVRRVEAGWPKDRFAEGLFREDQLARYMADHRGQRVIAFGHIEGVSTGKAAFVAYGPDQTSRVSLEQLLALARDNKVQLTVVGCRSYRAGAPAGPLYDLRGEDLPATLQAMRGAVTYGEFLAAMGDGRRPVIVDPAALLADVTASVRTFHLLGAERAVAVQVTREPVDRVGRAVAPETGGSPLAPPARVAIMVALCLALGVLVFVFGLLVPAAQILRWMRTRPGGTMAPPKRIEAIVAGLDRRLRLDGDLRKLLPIFAILAAPVLTDVVAGGREDQVLPALAAVPVLLLNLVGWAAGRSLGRGRP